MPWICEITTTDGTIHHFAGRSAEEAEVFADFVITHIEPMDVASRTTKHIDESEMPEFMEQITKIRKVAAVIQKEPHPNFELN